MKSLFLLVSIALLLVIGLATAQSTDNNNLLTVRFGLSVSITAQSNLEAELYRISDFNNKVRYNKHFSKSDIAAIVGLKDNEINQVKDWLNTIGATNVNVLSTKDYIQADVLSITYEKLQNKEIKLHNLIDLFHVIGSSANNIKTSNKQSKPATHVRRQYLTNQQIKAKQAGLIVESSVSRMKSPNDNTAGTPSNQRKSYQIPATLTGAGSKNNIQQVWGTATYGYLPSDLSKFYAWMQVDSNVNNVVAQGNKGTPGGDNFGEATLDIQCITGLATNIHSIVSNTNNASGTEDGTAFGTAFLQFVTDLSSGVLTPLPQTLSISLGSLSWDACNILCENIPKYSNNQYSVQQCQTYMQMQRQVCMYPDSVTVDRINYEFIKLGTQGVTILAATGDGGSHFSFQFFPGFGMGNYLNQISCAYQLPTFPAESPYVLGVGGSDWSSNGFTNPEAWSASGSGVSWRYTRPAYQSPFVSNYMTNSASSFPPYSSFNSSNRMYPDVAALATNVPIVELGFEQGAGGTSASAPEFAAVISLINDHRINNGLNSLGFVNPRLYLAATTHYNEMFTDMTTGTSACDSSGNCCNNGFPGAVGYDALTGLGQPLFPGLVKYLGSD